MPILLPERMRRLTQQEFHDLDYRVMGLAFEIHNQLGRHLDEEIYECELAYRLESAGVACQRQVPISFQFREYRTTLLIDMLIGSSTVYELKSAMALVPAHRAQTLNYVLATDTNFGKLVNFGTMKVASEFVSSTLTSADRRQFAIDDLTFDSQSSLGRQIREVAIELFADWGLFLECSLYRNALLYSCSGPQGGRQRVDLCLDGRSIGAQEVDLLDADTLLGVTAYPSEIRLAERHFRNLLRLTCRGSFLWINLRQHEIQFITLNNSAL